MRKENKKAILLFVLALIVSTILSFFAINSIQVEEDKGLNCSGIPGLCIEVYVKSYSDSAGFKESSFTYPSFRQGDYLRIDEVRIYSNEENSTILNLYTNVLPEGGNTPGAYTENYGEQHIGINKNLSKGEFYLMKRKKYNFYEHFYNGENVRNSTLYTIELYKPGEWLFQLEPQNEIGERQSVSYTTLKNGRWRGDAFFVGSRHEMDSLRENRNAVDIAIIAFIFILVFTVFQTWKKELGDLVMHISKRWA